MKKKLNLGQLQVKSFVTEIQQQEKVKGGANKETIICLTGMYPTLPVNACLNSSLC